VVKPNQGTTNQPSRSFYIHDEDSRPLYIDAILSKGSRSLLNFLFYKYEMCKMKHTVQQMLSSLFFIDVVLYFIE